MADDNDDVNTDALNITQIQEEEDTSMEESVESSVDLSRTLQEEMALRKKLDLTFAHTEIDAVDGKVTVSSGKPPSRSTGSNDSSSSIQSKISLFEQKATENKAFKPPLVPGRSFAEPGTTTTTRTASSPNEAAASTAEASAKSSAKRETKKFKVFLRLRPCVNSEESFVAVLPPENKPVNGSGDPPTKVRVLPPPMPTAHEHSSKSTRSRSSADGKVKEFCFQQVFDKDSTQVDVYNRTAAPLVNQLCSGNRVGQSSLLFSYGITNAGKTYTILGNLARNKRRQTVSQQQQEEWGVVPRCLQQVLQKVSNTDLVVSLSIFEIYNENVYDLLANKNNNSKMFGAGPPTLKLRESKGKTVVKGLTKHNIESLERGLEIVLEAKERRHSSNNHLNRHSSRSHCVCQITVSLGAPSDDASVDSASASSIPASATLWVVDLAGSERSKRTHGSSQKESAFINKSLLTLGGCLTRGERNYRDSKLTTLFMHHWMRNGTTSIIVNVHPTKDDYDETQHVLAYAASAKIIPNPERRILPTNAAAKKVPAAAKKPYSSMPSPGVKVPRKRKNTEPSSHEIPTKPAHRSKRMKPDTPPGRSKKSATISSGEVSRRLKMTKQDSQVDASKKSCSASEAALKKELAKVKEALQSEKMAHESTAQNEAALKKELVEAKEQIEMLEATVRAEVSEEISSEMEAMSQRYEASIRDLKAKEAASLERASRSEQRANQSEKETAQMAERLAELEAQLEKERKSKEEIVKSYDLIKNGENNDDDDEEEDEPTKTPPRKERVGGGHYQKPLKCATEPRVRRKLVIKVDVGKENHNAPHKDSDRSNVEDETVVRKPLSNTVANKNPN